MNGNTSAEGRDSKEITPDTRKLKFEKPTKDTADLDDLWLDPSLNKNKIMVKVEEAVKFIMANLRSTSSLRRRFAALALRQLEVFVRTVDLFKEDLAIESDVKSAE